MKKLLSLIVAAVLLLSVFSFSASADSIHKAQCGHIADNVGRTVAVPVSYSCDDGVYIARIFIDFDTSALKFVKTENTLTDKFGYTVNEKNGRVTVVMDAKTIANVSGNLELFKVYFEIQDTAKTGSYALTLSGDATRLGSEQGKFEAEGVDIEFSHGSVNVICKEHSFTEETEDGKKCESCDAVQNKEQQVTVPIKPEDTKEEIVIKPGEATIITEDDAENDGKFDTLSVVLILVAAILVIAATVFVIIKLKKSKKEA